MSKSLFPVAFSQRLIAAAWTGTRTREWAAFQEMRTMSSTPSFEELGLRPELLRAVADSGYTHPTPIQAQAIPVILDGRDVMGGAQTGTGKTAGFALPILQKLLPMANVSPSPARHPVRALILAPTRELAIQVEEAVKTYGKYTGLRSTCVFGGVDIKQQLPIVRAGVEILVATPGRLLDHIEQKSINLGQVEIFVLERSRPHARHGLHPGHQADHGAAPVTAKRQNLLFSATFSMEIKKLADQLLNAPQLIEVASAEHGGRDRDADRLQSSPGRQARRSSSTSCARAA
jgi:ATP-dependent RNA helicase RhlE